MNQPLDLEAVRARLTPERVRRFQTIVVVVAAILMVGIAVIFFVYGLGSESPIAEGDVHLARFLSITYGIISAMLLVLAPLVLRRGFRPGFLTRPDTAPASVRGQLPADVHDRAIFLLERIRLIRVASFAAVAINGLAFCILAMKIGVLFYHPEFFVLAVPACALLAYIAVTFPTHERLLTEIRTQLFEKQ